MKSTSLPRSLHRLALLLLLLAGLFAGASRPAQAGRNAPEVYERMEQWAPRLESYITQRPDGASVLSAERWKAFVATLPENLQKHYGRGPKLPGDLDVQAIDALRKSINPGNAHRRRAEASRTAAANEKLGFSAGCWQVEIKYYKIEVRATGACATRALSLMGACQKLPWPFSFLAKSKICQLYPKAKEHMAKCGYGGFKLKYYYYRNQFNVGC